MLRRDLRRADSSFRQVAEEAAQAVPLTSSRHQSLFGEGVCAAGAVGEGVFVAGAVSAGAVLAGAGSDGASAKAKPKRVCRAVEYSLRRQTMTLAEREELAKANRRAGAQRTHAINRLRMEEQAAEKHARDEQAAMLQEHALPNTAFGAQVSMRPGSVSAEVARWNADGARYNSELARGNAEQARWNAASGQMCQSRTAAVCQVCQSPPDGTMISCARCQQFTHLHCVVAIPKAVVCAYCYQMYSVEQNMKQQ